MTGALSSRLLSAIGNGLRDALDRQIEALIVVSEDVVSVRAPGWFEAHCECGWLTSGRYEPVEESAKDHVIDKHPPLAFRLCQAHREIVEMWATARSEYEVAAEHCARFVGTEQEFDRLDEAVGVAVERLQVTEQVLKALAKAYGIEEVPDE